MADYAPGRTLPRAVVCESFPAVRTQAPGAMNGTPARRAAAVHATTDVRVGLRPRTRNHRPRETGDAHAGENRHVPRDRCRRRCRRPATGEQEKRTRQCAQRDDRGCGGTSNTYHSGSGHVAPRGRDTDSPQSASDVPASYSPRRCIRASSVLVVNPTSFAALGTLPPLRSSA